MYFLGIIVIGLIVIYIIHLKYLKQRDLPRIILWTAPRCVSTAFERAIMQIPNGKIFHEPYSIPYYFGPEKVSQRYKNKKDLHNDKTFESVSKELMNKEYDENKNIDFIFIKDMAYYVNQFDAAYFSHLLTFRLKPPRFHHTFLIRRPDKVIVSLYKASINQKLTGWDHFDKNEIGFNDLYFIYKRCKELEFGYNEWNDILIIDADDLLSEPEIMLKKYCDIVGLNYNRNMTKWKAGNVDEFKCWNGWHDQVVQSSGFKKRTKQQIETKEKELKQFIQDQLPTDIKQEIEKAFVIYRELYENRLRPKQAPYWMRSYSYRNS